MKLALWSARGALLTARVKKTVQANRKRRVCPFVNGDLVYVHLPKRHASWYPSLWAPTASQKISATIHIVSSCRTPSDRGAEVYTPSFESLLRIHVANDDRLFPGCNEEQVLDLGGDGRGGPLRGCC